MSPAGVVGSLNLMRRPTVGILLIVIALTLPVVACERSWPRWLVLVSGALAFLGFFKANYGRIEIVDGRGGIPRVIASALAANSIICAVLFEVGHLLAHL
jgi:hypothetical protein